MKNHTSMAVPLSELREQEQQRDKALRFIKLSAAALCIIGAASHWQDVMSTISTQEANKQPVSSHRQVVGTPQIKTSNVDTFSDDNVAETTIRVNGPFGKINDMSRNMVMGAANTVKAAVVAVGFHRNSKAYQAKPELEQTLMTDHGAQKELAQMISTTYKVPYNTASLIVTKSIVESKKHQIDPYLVLALFGQESSFNPKAKSSYGAEGLAQVVPRFHRENMKKVGISHILEASIDKQIELGAVVLKTFLGTDNTKPVELGLQHYNQGENAEIIDPTWKYANGVLDKRLALTATVAHYVKESAPSQYTSFKSNL